MARDVGDYRIEELIGYGGAGEVWRARRRGTDEVVALKWLRGADPAMRDRQLREAALLAAVSHPHLVTLREVVSDHGDTVLVLDHLAGGSLASLLARRGRLTPGEVVSVIAPLAAALAYAHDEGLVHADVTPGNVLFTAEGRSVLTDLGIARVLGDSGEDGAVSATAEYVDPVVARGAVPGPASDVFGLAAVAFHALTGVPPWNAATAIDALGLAAAGELPDLHRLAPQAPAGLLDVLARALSARPELRGTAAELALDVRHACRPEPVQLAATGAGLPLRTPMTGALTQAVRPVRPPTTGPAHAAAPRERGRLATALRAGVRLGPRRGFRDAAICLAVLVAMAAAVLLGIRWGGGTAAPPAAAVGPALAGDTPASSAQPVNEFSVPDRPEQWAVLLGLLYDRRAAAFGTADPAALDGVYTTGSTQGAADRAEIQRLAAAGQALRGFAPQVLSVQSTRGEPPTVTLQITDSYAPYDVVAGQQLIASDPGRAPAEVSVSLQLTPAGWRIDSALRLSDPS